MLPGSIIRAVVQAWNLPGNVSCTPVDSFGGGVFKLCGMDGDTCYLKRRPARDDVAREFTLLSWLHAEGVMTAPPLLTQTGQAAMQIGDEILALYPALHGDIVPDHYAPGAEERAIAYGVGIARLHQALARYPMAEDFRCFDMHAEITGWVAETAKQHAAVFDAALVSDTIEYVSNDLRDQQPRLPVHLIHRDLHPANMLMQELRVAGYLDFDIACVGPRMFDPCYCLTSMLIGGFSREENRHHWLSLLSHLFAGYGSTVPVQEDEREAVFSILLAIELLFLALSCRTGRVDAARCNAQVIAWLTANRQSIEEAVRPGKRKHMV